eukprot:CAMPEP_0114661046 /NCGR_PEP_ID=MMETSP0191-20121206/21522_1 /TAXON_ID=126664 /ORGANISM="Sorites sp." /LENGTH=210 /DNA_ID=CAMNT_0001892009 /DNA_START=69 /DNA_END=701 /DNA_ORIENTATION=+
MAATVPTCSRCNQSGHVAVQCSKPFIRVSVCKYCKDVGHEVNFCPKLLAINSNSVCNYCKDVGHGVKSCPKLAKKKAKVVDDSSSVISTSSESTAATSVVARTWAKQGANTNKFNPGKADHSPRQAPKQTKKVAVVDPKPQWLSEAEEVEARKIEKKLRDIAALKAKHDAGEKLDVLQIKKMGTRAELEDRDVMIKIRLGFVRLRLETDK